jgi:predicted nucleic acid-binding protein
VIVLDASAAVDLLLDLRPQADWVRERLPRGEEMHAPHLIDVEFGSAVRRRAQAGEIDDERGDAVLALLRDLPLVRYPHTSLLPRMWEHRHRLTFADAAYVALAEALDATLVTTDERLGRADLGHRVAAFPSPL